MTMQQPDNAHMDGNAIVIERTFDAPRDLVWRVWTEAEHVAKWWGPPGITTRVEQLDLRVGGDWRYVLVMPDGNEMGSNGTFSEVTPPERLAMSAHFDNDPDPTYVQNIIVTFEEKADGTKVTMRVEHRNEEDCKSYWDMGVAIGWDYNFQSLEAYLASLAG